MDADEGLVIDLDLEDNHTLTWLGWSPDRALNPQYAGLPDVERIGAIVTHWKPDGSPCRSAIRFDGEVQRKLEPVPVWTVETWEPLTLSPSILCRICGDHGFIRNGKWARA